MERRRFITTGSGGLVGLVLAGGARRLSPAGEPVAAQATEIPLSLEQAIVPMVDGTPMYMWAFKAAGAAARVPGPVIRARAGETLNFSVTNNLDEPHRFAIAGVASTDDIAPGATATLTVTAPTPGTYLYLDPLNAPANRLLGLHGVLIVLPAAPAAGNNLTPYADTPPAMQQLFNDLSSADSMFATPGPQGTRIAGGAWNPAKHGKDLVWVFGQIDPRWHTRAQTGQAFTGAAVKADFVPRYFTMNGKSGYFSATDPDTAPHGVVGEPCLLRCVMVGIGTQAPHIHGNHIFELSRRLADEPVQPASSVLERDTWVMDELRIADALLPFRKPPDIWPWPPVDLATFERQLPLFFPMHCHNQPTNTAGGGSYPQGTITHWSINGFPGVTKIVAGH